ncbi:MAG: LptF/LptG family permease [Muribaculaceae bacterium]|nr:LptF/LptG family permease [Muribaculaceae bacterium]
MFGIKRLDTFLLQRFLPLLLMTFFIVLFIVLMQFLFRMIDDLVGKGLSFDILGELFWYAALTMVPTALPLAVLLASLMVFGNLGEKLELTALKAAGINLFRIMRPLIILMVFIAIGAFFFQNYVLPVAQSKMWTLMFSVRQKSPEVEIPEGQFYSDIPGMNMYVERKNPETGMLYDMIIYDLTRGAENVRVILADSGRFAFTDDKTHLFLHLHTGEMFENLNDNSMGIGTGGYMPFRRETFFEKQVYFTFDANFNRMDESGIRSQYVGQNVSQLRKSIDSIHHRVDSIGNVYATDLLVQPSVGLNINTTETDSSGARHVVPAKFDEGTLAAAQTISDEINLDSLFVTPSPSYMRTYVNQAIADARQSRREFEYRTLMLEEQGRLMRRHAIEMQRKFTLSVAVLLFFFIGAPLGAIIKKGGLGTPLVISIFLFIVYYIFDNTGYKMARDGKLEVWQGMWLSTIVLLPLGVFFTSKAVDDSAVFNADAYRLFFERLIGRRRKRDLMPKDIIMTEVDVPAAISELNRFAEMIKEAKERVARTPRLWRRLDSRPVAPLKQPLETVIDHLANSRDKMIVNLLNDYPFHPRPSDLDAMAATTAEILARLEIDSPNSDTIENS